MRELSGPSGCLFSFLSCKTEPHREGLETSPRSSLDEGTQATNFPRSLSVLGLQSCAPQIGFPGLDCWFQDLATREQPDPPSCGPGPSLVLGGCRWRAGAHTPPVECCSTGILPHPVQIPLLFRVLRWRPAAGCSSHSLAMRHGLPGMVHPTFPTPSPTTASQVPCFSHVSLSEIGPGSFPRPHI